MPKNETSTYPISRALTTPVGGGLVSAAHALAFLGGAKLLGNKSKLIRNFIAKHPKASTMMNPSASTIGIGVGASGLVGGMVSSVNRGAYANEVSNKLIRHGKFSDQEKNLLLKDVNTKSFKKKLRARSTSEMIVSPTANAALGAGLTALTGNYLDIPIAATQDFATTKTKRALLTRALAGRLQTGGLKPAEQRLKLMLDLAPRKRRGT